MLSGGEKVRLALCKILKTGPNVLILEEPTNHMDIVGKESLENMLSEYKGTLIFVSHDRFFVKKIANKILEFDKNKVKFYDLGYEAYLEKKLQEVDVEEKTEKKEKKTYINPLKEKDKLERKVKKLEDEISRKEDEIQNLKEELTKEEIYSDYVKVSEIQEKINSLNDALEADMIEWENLTEELDNVTKLL